MGSPTAGIVPNAPKPPPPPPPPTQVVPAEESKKNKGFEWNLQGILTVAGAAGGVLAFLGTIVTIIAACRKRLAKNEQGGEDPGGQDVGDGRSAKVAPYPPQAAAPYSQHAPIAPYPMAPVMPQPQPMQAWGAPAPMQPAVAAGGYMQPQQGMVMVGPQGVVDPRTGATLVQSFGQGATPMMSAQQHAPTALRRQPGHAWG